MSAQKSILTYFARDAVKRNPLVGLVNSPSKRFKSSPSKKSSNSGEEITQTKDLNSECDVSTGIVEKESVKENNDQSINKDGELNRDDNKDVESSTNTSGILTGDDTEPGLSVQDKIELKKLQAKLKLLSNRYSILDPNMSIPWFAAMEEEFSKPYFKELNDFINTKRKSTKVFPPADQVWSWTKHCELKDLKVVIIGQDPYHNYGQAHGLSFSVRVGVPKPPSLINIFKELSQNYTVVVPDHGYLVGWARQGVLLLNAVLTVEEKLANSHKGRGWEKVTTGFIKYINKHLDGLVFMLWGRNAQQVAEHVDKTKHHILTAGHPSPLSVRLFTGCSHFKKCNEILKKQNKAEINWNQLPAK